MRWLERLERFADGIPGTNPGANPAPSRPSLPRAPGTVDALDSAEDPMGALWHHVSYLGEMSTRGRLLIGAARDPLHGIVLNGTEPESNVLIIGPPRSNKTTGFLAPQIIAHLGPTFVITTKDDLAELTAVACARKGEVIHLNLTAERTYPGMVQGRWSILADAVTWTEAKRRGAAIAKAATPARASNHSFWRDLGADFMAPAIYAVALTGRGHSADGYSFFLDVMTGDEPAEDEMLDALSNAGEDGRIAQAKWQSFKTVHPEGYGSIRLTVMHALSILERPEVRRLSDRPNIDINKLLAYNTAADVNPHVAETPRMRSMAVMGIAARDGWPRIGSCPTVYVTVDQGDEQAAVLTRAFVHYLWECIKARHREDRYEGLGPRPKVLVAWDELATGFPDPDYPTIVAQCADQGMIVTAAIHDLGQTVAKWGAADAASFTNLHRTIVVFPRITHAETLQTISTVLGYRWETRSGTNSSTSMGNQTSFSHGRSSSDHRLPTLDPGEIWAGRPGDPKAVLVLHPGGWTWAWPTPLWAARPWPRALVASMEYVDELAGDHPSNDPYWRLGALPLPELDRLDLGGTPLLISTQRDGSALYNRYRQLAQRFGNRRAVLRAARNAARNQRTLGGREP